MSQIPRAGAAVAAALASSLGLVACSPVATEESMATVVESAVDSVDHVTGSFAAFTSSGASNSSILVNIYVDTTDESLIIAAADDSLRAIWQSVGIRPTTVSISVATTPKPENPLRLEANAIDPAPIAIGLAIADSRVIRQLFMVHAGSMDQRYGEWAEPAA